MALYFCRAQVIKGHLTSRIYRCSVIPTFPKPIKHGELRILKGKEWLDLYSYSAVSIEEYTAKLRETPNLPPSKPTEPRKRRRVSKARTSKRQALKAEFERIRAISI